MAYLSQGISVFAPLASVLPLRQRGVVILNAGAEHNEGGPYLNDIVN